MSFNGSGTFLINTAGQPVVSGTVISSTAFNALTADLATGLSTCITKDGQTTPTANIPMGSNRITGLGSAVDATDAVTFAQVQTTTAKLIGSISGTNTITGSLTPALTAYATGQMFYFVSAGANTGAVTLNINSLGAKSVTRDGTTALIAGNIASGEVVVVVYDGTQFQMLNPTTISVPTLNIVTGTTQTATAGNQYVLTNAAATTVTLPASPTSGDMVWVTVANGLTTNVVARNGKPIQGIAEDMTLNAPYASAQLRFVDNTEGWILI